MISLPSELVQIIVWDVFFIHDFPTAILTVSKQWHRFLTNINTMVKSPKIHRQKMYLALKLNRSIILEATIAKYFPTFTPHQSDQYESDQYESDQYESDRYLDMFCAAYNRRTWQHMYLPILEDFHTMSRTGVHHCNDYINKCQSVDAFFYLYKCMEPNPIPYMKVLYRVCYLTRKGQFALKHLNWLINLLHRDAARIVIFNNVDPDHTRWQYIFRTLIKLNYPLVRIRKFVDHLLHFLQQKHGSGANTRQAHQFLHTVIVAFRFFTICPSEWSMRVEKLEKELVYYQCRIDMLQLSHLSH